MEWILWSIQIFGSFPPRFFFLLDFFRESTKHLIQFLAYEMQDFRNFVLQNRILIFDAEQVCLKPQVFNFKNKEVTATLMPKP